MEQTPGRFGKNLLQGVSWQKSLVILPVSLLVALILTAAILDPTLVFVLPVFLQSNSLFLSLIPFTVAYPCVERRCLWTGC